MQENRASDLTSSFISLDTEDTYENETLSWAICEETGSSSLEDYQPAIDSRDPKVVKEVAKILN